MIQRSEEWFEARLGKATASRFSDVLSKLKSGGESAGRKNYRAQLVTERLTGARAERFQSPEMSWGQDTEGLARLTYTLTTGNQVEEVGLIDHPALMAGASPDGLVGEDGTIEIKCPTTANHIETLKAQEVPSTYTAQIQGQLWITERKWCDFVSFDPTLPQKAQIFIFRVYRDDEYINALEDAVTLFLAEVDEDVKFIQGYEPVKAIKEG